MAQTREGPAGRRRRKPRPGPTVSPAAGWGWRSALLAYLVVLALDFGLAVAVPHHLLRIGVGSLALDAAMGVALLAAYRRRPFTATDLGLRGTSGPSAVGLTFVAVIVYFAAAAIWLVAIMGRPRHQVTPQLHAGPVGLIVAGLAMCCVAPVTEELFFRGFLYRALRNRLGVIWSVVIVAVLFAAGHASTYPVDTLPIKGLFAVITCLLYERTRSLYPGIALHVLVDSTGYEASVSQGGLWIVPASFALIAMAILAYERLRPPTPAERAAWLALARRSADRGVPGAPSVPSDDRLPGSQPRLVAPLIVRFGHHSVGFVLGMGGVVMVLIGAVLAAVGPHHTGPSGRPDPTVTGVIGGTLLILGLMMIAAGILWRVFRRPRPD